MEKRKFFAIRKGDSTGIFYETYSQTLLRHPKEFKSFKKREEAEQYMQGKAAEGAVSEPVDLSEAEALVFADGSMNFHYGNMKGMKPEELYVTYGLVIFFRENKGVYYESGKLVDHPNQETPSFSVWRYGMNGERVDQACHPLDGEALPEEFSYEDKYKDNPKESAATNSRRHRLVLAGGADTAELEGLKRGLEICFDERKLRKVAVIFDSAAIENIYNGGYSHEKNGSYFYGTTFEKYDNEAVRFVKVKSHEKGDFYSVFNDCVDILAKSETHDKPIGKGENPNLKAYFEHIEISKDDTVEVRRKKARRLVQEVIENEKGNLF